MLYFSGDLDLGKRTIFCLPGRGKPLHIFSKQLLDFGFDKLEDFNIITLANDDLSWYPPPNGIDDQEMAIYGLKDNAKALSFVIKRMQKRTSIVADETFICGHSSGGAIALEMCTYSEKIFNTAFIYSGVHLDPKNINDCKNTTKIQMYHAINDEIFKWEERYIPTKNALLKNSYNVEFFENDISGHALFEDEIRNTVKYLKENT